MTCDGEGVNEASQLVCGTQDVGFKEKHWHEKCFVCVECKANLIDKPFAHRDNALLCAVCYEKNPSVCAACQKPFHLGISLYTLHPSPLAPRLHEMRPDSFVGSGAIGL